MSMTLTPPAVDELAVLGDAVDALLGVQVALLPDAEVERAVVRLQRELSRLSAVQARVVAEWEARALWGTDGSKSSRAALARRTGVSKAAAGAACRRARRLREMPLVAAALAAGEISADHVDVLGAAWSEERAEAFGRDEARLLGFARDLDFADFTRAVRYWRQCADDSREEERARRQHAERHLEVAATFQGTVDVRGTLDAIGGAIVSTELRRLEQELFEADWAAARAEYGDRATADHLPRTSAQRRADAIVEMARRSAAMPAHHRPARPLITVLVGYETLSGRVCELSDGTVITPGQVATLLTEADVERIVFDSPSRVIDVGERRRFFGGALRRAIEVRDRRCTHPGCGVPAEQCQVDHIIEYTAGGLTTQTNGRLLCPVHNRRRPGRRGPPDQPP